MESTEAFEILLLAAVEIAHFRDRMVGIVAADLVPDVSDLEK